eukprot:gene1657-1209_t
MSFNMSINLGQQRQCQEYAYALKTSYERMKDDDLRQRGFLLFASDQVGATIETLERSIERDLFQIRDDREIHLDLGLQEEFFEMIFSYEHRWLKLGLQTIFGETIEPPKGKGTKAKWRQVLKQFIVKRILQAEMTVDDAFRQTNGLKAIEKKKLHMLYQHILKKTFVLVHFLDAARMGATLPVSNLFEKDAVYKSSKDILTSFARLVLKSEGDVMKHLGSLGCFVHFQQSFLDEFDFSVRDLANDLKDGVRLVRLYELLAGIHHLSADLRVPAISRLQKIHNVKLALQELFQRGEACPDPKAIVDGDVGVVSVVLWKMIYAFELKSMVDKGKVKREVDSLKTHLAWSKFGDLPTESSSDEDSIENLLLNWCQTIVEPYGIFVENLGSSIRDGRVICLIINFYHPTLLPVSLVKDVPGDWATASLSKEQKEKCQQDQKKNWHYISLACKALGGIPSIMGDLLSKDNADESIALIFVSYLFSRLVDSTEVLRAALKIQSFFRKYCSNNRVASRRIKTRNLAKHLLKLKSNAPVRSTVARPVSMADQRKSVLSQQGLRRSSAVGAMKEGGIFIKIDGKVQAYDPSAENQKLEGVEEILADDFLQQVISDEREETIDELLGIESDDETQEQEQALKQAEEEARLQAEEEARLRAEEEARLQAEEEARLLAEEEARLKAEEEARLLAEEEARLKAEEEEEARLKAEEEARLRAEEEARLKAEEEARLRAEEEARLRAEEEARLLAEEEARLKAEEEARLRAEEEARLRAEEEARLLAEEEARLRAEEEARLQAEEEARLRAEEEARLQAEEEARLKAEEEARLRAEEEARLRAEEEARIFDVMTLETRAANDAFGSELCEALLNNCDAAISGRSSAACRIQAHIRMRQQHRLYQCGRLAVIILQDLWRRKVIYRNHIATINAHATNIAKNFRSHVARNKFLLLKAAAVCVQTNFRRFSARQRFVEMCRSLVTLQCFARVIIAKRRSQRVAAAAATIKKSICAYRYRVLLIAAVCDFVRNEKLRHEEEARLYQEEQERLAKMDAAAREQYRLELGLQKLLGLRQHRCSRKIAAAMRAFVIHKHHTTAAGTIQRMFRARRPLIRCRQLLRSFRAIVARFRGRKVRKQSKKKLREIISRLEKANEQARLHPTTTMTLGQKTAAALHTLQTAKMISALIKACQALQTSTLYSRDSCEKFVMTDSARILFALIQSCNRSQPHQELLRLCLLVLLNVTRYPHLSEHIGDDCDESGANAADVLIDLMQMFRDKQSVFKLSTHLLGTIVECSAHAKSVCAVPGNKRRLDGIAQILERKQRIESKCKSHGSSATNLLNSLSSPDHKNRRLSGSSRDSLKEREDGYEHLDAVTSMKNLLSLMA